MDAAPAQSLGEGTPFAGLWPVLEQLHAADLNISLIRASDGFINEQLADEWLERLPGSRVMTVPGPHNLHEAAPKELASALGSLSPL